MSLRRLKSRPSPGAARSKMDGPTRRAEMVAEGLGRAFLQNDHACDVIVVALSPTGAVGFDKVTACIF